MLKLIDLDIPELNYRKFITAWLYSGPEGHFLVDTGPACTADSLFAAMSDAGVDHLDWILLTHIHLDHAGGVGRVLKKFPEAAVACHEKAVPHLADPARLWEASVKALGRVAQVYGPMEPVPADKLHVRDRIPFGEGVRVIATPGHAAHHQSFIFSDWLFCGELLGVYMDLDGGMYLRPATPPRFILEEFLSSMDRIAPYADRHLCFAHYGIHPDGRKILDLFRKQLLLWVEIVRSHVRQNPAEDTAAQPDLKAVISDLADKDELFAPVRNLPAGLREREDYFIRNSIQGIVQYLKNA